MVINVDPLFSIDDEFEIIGYYPKHFEITDIILSIDGLGGISISYKLTNGRDRIVISEHDLLTNQYII